MGGGRTKGKSACNKGTVGAYGRRMVCGVCACGRGIRRLGKAESSGAHGAVFI